MGDRWDLVVAGAGPAGCALAAKVAAAGCSVLLLERESEPGSGRDWIVDVARNTFEAAVVPEPATGELFEEPERTVLVSSDRACAIELLPAPVVPVRNAPYVRQLAAWAVDCGAVLRTSCAVADPIIEGDCVVGLRTAGRPSQAEEIRGTIVADCTGIGGTLRRRTPPSWRLADAVAASDIVLARRETRAVEPAAAERAMQRNFMVDRVRIGRSGAQGVYSIETCFLDLRRRSIDILVGVKPGSGPDADTRFEQILRDRPYIGEKVFGDGGPIPIRKPLDTFVADGFVTLGDSACQVIPAHGSGTASALIAADLASASIIRALEQGRRDRQALWGYNHAFLSGRGALLAYYDVIRRHADTLTVDDLDLLLARGVLTAREVFSGLVPEAPTLGPAAVADKLRGGPGAVQLLLGFARSGMLAARVMKHYGDYPPFYRPGAVDDWVRRMPHARPKPGRGSGGL